MANIYVRSTDGNNADSGATWALAKADLTGAAAIDAAGDNIYVSQVHAESTAGTVTIALANSPNNPVNVICVNDAAEPPTAVATTATVTTNGNFALALTGSAYVYGITFISGGASNSIQLAGGAGNNQRFENCGFRLTNTATTPRIFPGPTGGVNQQLSFVLFENCAVRFANASQGIAAAQNKFIWNGGGIEAGGTAINALFPDLTAAGRAATIVCSGVDLSGLATSAVLVVVGGRNIFAIFRNCKLPASWSGTLTSGSFQQGDRIEMHNCDSTDTNYRIWVEDYAGSIKSETTIVRTGGASDGTTTLSWKMASSANANYFAAPLWSPEIVRWNETTGSSITVTVEILTDNVTLTDKECWLEVQYLGTSGFPLAVFGDDAAADVLAAATNQATSTETWTTTGIGTPVKQKLSVTFTPQEKGFIHAVVKLAKASTTVYVDPELTVS